MEFHELHEFFVASEFRVSATYPSTRIHRPANEASIDVLTKYVNLDEGKTCLEFRELHEFSPIKFPLSFVRLLCELIVLVQSF